LVNPELVDLDPVETSEELHALVVRHHEETGSDVAAELLADWDTNVRRFTNVIPRDYRLVMNAKAAAQAAGLDEASIANAMMEALHG
jgi:glutamate synthase (NADPH/NADH) large chain